MIFVDTSAWYASSSARDANHQDAKRFLASVRERLVTTDYVVDETLTLFRARDENQHALSFGAEVIDGSFAEIVTIDKQDFSNAWTVFQKFADKGWSFTDCASRVVMERLAIQTAFAFDEHFRQFGTIAVAPQAETNFVTPLLALPTAGAGALESWQAAVRFTATAEIL